jgi:hypothetical protein
MTYNSTVLADSPKHYITFDQTSGGYTDSGSQAATTTVTGSPVQVTGINGKALTYNGTSDYVTINSPYDFAAVSTFTFECWFKSTATTGQPTFIRRDGNGAAYLLRLNAGKIEFYCNQAGIVTTASYADGNWHHVVGVKNGTATTLYVDGTQVGTGTGGTVAQATGAQPIYLGESTSAASEMMKGTLDEVAIYPTALSSTRVTAHYNAAFTSVTTTPPVINVSTTGLTTVAPTVHIVSNDVTNVVPAAALSLTDPAPVVWGGHNNTVAVPAMTLSLTATAATFRLATAATVSITGNKSSGGTTNAIMNTSSGDAEGLAFSAGTVSVPTGNDFLGAYLNVSDGATTGSSVTFNIGYLNQPYANISGGALLTTSNYTVVGTATLTAGATSPTRFAIDVTGAVQAWLSGTPEYGLILIPTSFSNSNVHQVSGTNGGANAPSLTVLYAASPTPVTVTPPAMTLTLADPTPVVTAQRLITDAVPAIALSLDTAAPVISTDVTVTTSVPAMTASLASPNAKLQNFVGLPEAINAGIVAPDADLEIRYPITVQVPATYFGNLETEPAAVNLTTTRLVSAPAITVSLKWVGIYFEDADRYLTITQENIQSKDTWLKLNESQGATKAFDSSYAPDSVTSQYRINKQDVSIHGGVTNRVDGPYLRKAMNFNGVDAYLGDFIGSYQWSTEPPFYPGGNYTPLPNPEIDDNYKPEMVLTVEFSLRTTALNGVIWTGWSTYGFQWSAGYSPNGYDVALKDGYMHIISPDGTGVMYDQKVRVFLSDGNWHHIVVGIPDVDSGQYSTRGDSYIMIDGKPALVRNYGAIVQSSRASALAPYSFMGRPPFKKTSSTPSSRNLTNYDPKVPTGCLAGDLADVIIRPNTYLTMDQAQTIYYEWSNSTIVKPEALTVNLAAVKPEKAKGNQKRMLAIYGLPENYDNNGRPVWNYFSKLDNMFIENGPGYEVLGLGYETILLDTSVSSPNYDSSAATHGWSYPKPRVFDYGEYKVYPVAIQGNLLNRSDAPSSVDGILNPDAMVDENGLFIDDTTGLYRFINLQEDLLEDVTDFDCITAINYPWFSPDAFLANAYAPDNPFTGVYITVPNEALDQHLIFGGLNATQWAEARDALAESLLQAAYDGANLWIGEWHMAQNLGFINEVDIHDTGYWWTGTVGLDWSNRGGTDPATGKFDAAHANVHAQDLDRDHLAEGGASWNQTTWVDNKNKKHPAVTDTPTAKSTGFLQVGGSYTNWIYDPNGGWYDSEWQINHYRKVVAEVPDLTDLPTTEMANRIDGFSWDRFKPNGDFEAYDIVQRPNGLQVGDYSAILILDPSDSGDGDVANHGQNRDVIISARPDGIAGQVVTREMESYWAPNGVQVDNPFKDNAYTIAAEVGTIVRGKPIAGRAFIELMERAPGVGYIAVDADPYLWLGRHNTTQVSTWDYDDRRYLETVSVQTSSKQKADYSFNTIQSVTTYTYFISVQAGSYIHYAQPNWHYRGLNWLGKTPELPSGEKRVYAPPMLVSLVTPNAYFTKTANPTTQVIGAMNVFLEERQPANYHDGSVREFALPISLSLEMRGIGRMIYPTPLVVNLTTPAIVIKAHTETIPVYLDSSKTVTLYLKEEI